MRTAYCSRCDSEVQDTAGFCRLGHPLYPWSLERAPLPTRKARSKLDTVVGALIALFLYAMVAGVILQVNGAAPIETARFVAMEGDRPSGFATTHRVERKGAEPRPQTVMIWRLGIFAPIDPMGLESDGTLEVPDDAQKAGWFRKGPAPGQRGAAVVVGHYDSSTGPGIFYPLKKLRVGDEVGIVDSAGGEFLFEITRIEQVDKDLFPTSSVYGSTSKPSLRLITCKGDIDPATGHYTDNLIAYGRLVD
jgi:hypothetical protein